MLATPSPPRLNAHHAITEISITPLCQKTSSIPTDGKDFRAETLDFELLSHLEIKDIKASNLVNADSGEPLFIDGCWLPTLIRHILHLLTVDQAQNTGSSSQSTFAVRSRSSSSRKCFRGSHRQEAVTWAVPGMNTEEFIDAMLFPVAGNKETMVANWLNSIIDSFSPPQLSAAMTHLLQAGDL
ncbi:hypothetical protein BKA83DRAFT_4493379 [Pisolithus microcarpus]|nr:hypothetical protein BKA83DRAFT_4493379 [Pisolithus microcarpus]